MAQLLNTLNYLIYFSFLFEARNKTTSTTTHTHTQQSNRRKWMDDDDAKNTTENQDKQYKALDTKFLRNCHSTFRRWPRHHPRPIYIHTPFARKTLTRCPHRPFKWLALRPKRPKCHPAPSAPSTYTHPSHTNSNLFVESLLFGHRLCVQNRVRALYANGCPSRMKYSF